MKANTCPFAHSVHSCTGFLLLSMFSNHEFTGRPLVSSTMELSWFSFPFLPLPSSNLMTGSGSSWQLLPTPMPAFWLPTPRGSPDP